MPIGTIFFGNDIAPNDFGRRKLLQQAGSVSNGATAAAATSMKWKAALWEKDSIEPAMLRLAMEKIKI